MSSVGDRLAVLVERDRRPRPRARRPAGWSARRRCRGCRPCTPSPVEPPNAHSRSTRSGSGFVDRDPVGCRSRSATTPAARRRPLLGVVHRAMLEAGRFTAARHAGRGVRALRGRSSGATQIDRDEVRCGLRGGRRASAADGSRPAGRRRRSRLGRGELRDVGARLGDLRARSAAERSACPRAKSRRSIARSPALAGRSAAGLAEHSASRSARVASSRSAARSPAPPDAGLDAPAPPCRRSRPRVPRQGRGRACGGRLGRRADSAAGSSRPSGRARDAQLTIPAGAGLRRGCAEWARCPTPPAPTRGLRRDGRAAPHPARPGRPGRPGSA